MRRACVLGGGTAGVEAALALAGQEVRTTLFEESQRLPRPSREWPALLCGTTASKRDPQTLLLREGVEVRLGEKVLGVQERGHVTTSRGGSCFDSVVVTTGRMPVFERPRGAAKEGVHVLDSEDAFLALREASADASCIVLSGPVPTALEVAEKMLRNGVRVTLALREGRLPARLSAAVRGAVMAAARESGLSVVEAPLRKVVGFERVEAAVVGDGVIPCDCLVILPDHAPRVPSTSARLGNSGGILVDRQMRSSAGGIFAAGDCAEYATGLRSGPVMLPATASASGRAAGFNAGGGRFPFEPAASFSGRLFGLSVATTGLCLEEARVAGFDAVESTVRSDDWGASSIVFERETGRVLGVQMAVAGSGPQLDTLAIALSRQCLLSDLAFSEVSGSTDISPIIETAREGMRHWRRS